MFSHVFVKVSEAYLENFRKDMGPKEPLPEFYMETYSQDPDSERLLFRQTFTGNEYDWVRVHAPHKNNAQVTRIVFSQGLEIDNLRLMMELPVDTQYVRK